MSKSLQKKTGRPLANTQELFTEIAPNLSLGFSLYRACKIAQVPYTTVIDHYNRDEGFRSKVDALIEDTNVHARAKLAGRVRNSTYDGKAIEFWLKNMDEDFKDKPLNQTNVQVNVSPLLGGGSINGTGNNGDQENTEPVQEN